MCVEEDRGHVISDILPPVVLMLRGGSPSAEEKIKQSCDILLL